MGVLFYNGAEWERNMSKELKDVTKLKYYDVSSNNPIEAKLGISKRKKLYHYTTKIGSKGILESNTLWVTHSNFLDDIYDFSKQMILLLEDINEFYAELLNNLIREKTVNYMELIETIKSVIYIKIINYSFFFKHFNFAKEEECRVIFLVDEVFEPIKYKKKSNRKIPYIKVNFNKSSLLGTRFIQN